MLERVVVSASRSVDARLMAVLRSTGEWDRHCSAVRRYLLLGQVRDGGLPLLVRMVLAQVMLQAAAIGGHSAGLGLGTHHTLRTLCDHLQHLLHNPI